MGITMPFSTPAILGYLPMALFFLHRRDCNFSNFFIKCRRSPSTFHPFSPSCQPALFKNLNSQFRTWIIICKHPVPIPPTSVTTRSTIEDKPRQAKHSQNLIRQLWTRICFPWTTICSSNRPFMINSHAPQCNMYTAAVGLEHQTPNVDPVMPTCNNHPSTLPRHLHQDRPRFLAVNTAANPAHTFKHGSTTSFLAWDSRMDLQFQIHILGNW